MNMVVLGMNQHVEWPPNMAIYPVSNMPMNRVVLGIRGHVLALLKRVISSVFNISMNMAVHGQKQFVPQPPNTDIYRVSYTLMNRVAPGMD